jgi:tetratricopeptide (TPR) repeat protein
MKFSPLLLISLAVLLTLGLYQLPKSVVDNKDKNADGSKKNTEKQKEEAHAQGNSWGEKAQKEYQKLAEKYKQAKDNEKIALLDTFVVFFKKNMKFDSAATYQEKIAEKLPNQNNFQKTGDAYFEAFNYALSVDENKAKKLATKTQEYYQKIIEKNPNQLDIKANLAMTYIFDKNPMKPVLTLRENLVENPKHEKTLLYLGLLAIRSQQYDKAVGRFEELINLNPKNYEAKLYYADVLITMGNKKEAKKILEEIANLKNDSLVNFKMIASDALKKL